MLVRFSLFLLVAASFFIYQAQKENKVGQHSKIKNQGTCKNGGECYCLTDEDIVLCNCIWLHGGRRFEKYMQWTWLGVKIKKR